MLARAAKRCALGVCMLGLLFFGASSLPIVHMAQQPEAPDRQLFGLGDGSMTYLQWLNTKADKVPDAGLAAGAITIAATEHQAWSDDSMFEDRGQAGVLWKDGESWIEYALEAPEDGLYNVSLTYDTADDKGLDMTRGLQIDGAYPYSEASHLLLKREFIQTRFPLDKDNYGNELSPVSSERKGWRTAKLSDFAVSTQPLKFHLTAGKHTIRLTSEQQPLLLKQITLEAPVPLKSYAEASADYPAPDANRTWIGIFEAEQPTLKSNPSIRAQSAIGTLMSPEVTDRTKYNNIGGDGFGDSGQWIEWDFEVPADGRYEIGFRYLQLYVNNSYAFRNITIDGEPLFEELQSVGFPYDGNWEWNGLTLSDAGGEPLLFYLREGKHTMRMTVTAAPNRLIYEGILRNLNQIGALNQQIRRVTGLYDRASSGADANRSWDLEQYIPDIKAKLNRFADDLLQLADIQASATMGRGETETSFRRAADNLHKLANNISQVPNRLNWLEDMTNDLASWTFNLLNQKLGLDYFWVAEPGAKKPRIKAGFMDNLTNQVKRWWGSYTSDYDFRSKLPNALQVWVVHNRETAELIQRFADNQFTKETGIPVNINIVGDPSQKFLLGNISGEHPDIALGLPQDMAGDFGMRGALVELSALPGYAETTKVFQPGALRTFHYDGGDYALPETQPFNVLIYRTDILKELGVEPPDTWEDVIKILPALQQQGYDFNLSPNDFQTFVYQHGGDLYTADGLSSGMDSPEAYDAVKQWTDMFTVYQVPRNVLSFYTRFKIGQMPIGIADYQTYLQISFAAPEMQGRWKILPIPGTKQPDGTVVRWSPGYMNADVIFRKSEKQEDAWKFLQWWLSTDTQSQFGNEVEALLGPTYRWSTANTEAFPYYPWPKDDLKVIMEQRRWLKEAPIVPGFYMTGRMITDTWKSVVNSGTNVRETLEQAVADINRELHRKQREFGLRDERGNVIGTLDVPMFDQPWEGGANP